VCDYNKKSLDFGGDLAHVTLGLGLRLHLRWRRFALSQCSRVYSCYITVLVHGAGKSNTGQQCLQL